MPPITRPTTSAWAILPPPWLEGLDAPADGPPARVARADGIGLEQVGPEAAVVPVAGEVHRARSAGRPGVARLHDAGEAVAGAVPTAGHEQAGHVLELD